jgi:hypothetical protein
VAGCWGEDRIPYQEERTLRLRDSSYGFAGMEIAMEKGGSMENPERKKLLLAIRLDGI